MARGKGQTTQKKLDQHVAEEIAAYEKDRVRRTRRFLRRGESVPVPFLGLPGVKLAGTELEVFEYPDGRVEPIIPRINDLMRSLFMMIVLKRGEALPTSEELRFLRKSMGLTQEELAQKLGCSRENIHRHESGKVRNDRCYWLMLRGEALLYWLNDAPPEFKKENKGIFEALQDHISGSVEGVTIEFPSGDTTETRNHPSAV